MLAELINVKIGDLANRILDEIIHDLTPYGYKELANGNVYVSTKNDVRDESVTGYEKSEVDAMRSIQSNNTDGTNPATEANNIEATDNISEYDGDLMSYVATGFKACDVIADIVISNETGEAETLTDEISKYIAKDTIREIATGNMMSRKMMALQRKSLARYAKKIKSILVENTFDMSIEKDAEIDMNITPDRVIRTEIKKDFIEKYIVRLKREKY